MTDKDVQSFKCVQWITIKDVDVKHHVLTNPNSIPNVYHLANSKKLNGKYEEKRKVSQ